MMTDFKRQSIIELFWHWQLECLFACVSVLVCNKTNSTNFIDQVSVAQYKQNWPLWCQLYESENYCTRVLLTRQCKKRRIISDDERVRAPQRLPCQDSIGKTHLSGSLCVARITQTHLALHFPHSEPRQFESAIFFVLSNGHVSLQDAFIIMTSSKSFAKFK